jgi:hypothetical protein
MCPIEAKWPMNSPFPGRRRALKSRRRKRSLVEITAAPIGRYS